MRHLLPVLLGLTISATPLLAQGEDADALRPFATGVITHLWSLGPSRAMTGTAGVGLSYRGLRLHVQVIDIGALKLGDDRNYRWRPATRSRECEHVPTGATVEDELCLGPWTRASAVELLRAFGTDIPVMIGGGYRFGDNTTPFGTVAVALSTLNASHLLARLSVGRDYVQLGFGVGWTREH